MSDLYVYVSEEDLKHPLTKRMLLATGVIEIKEVDTYHLDENKVRRALYSLWGISGVSGEAQYEAEVVEHRTRIEKKVVKCVRYCGIERTDREWGTSAMASAEVASRFKGR